jgi:PIN domain
VSDGRSARMRTRPPIALASTAMARPRATKSAPLPTVSERLGERAEKIRALVEELLTHSALHQWNYPGSGIMSTSGNHSWRLADEGRRVRSRVLEDYRRYAAIVRVLLVEQPKATQKDFAEADKKLTQILEQSGTTWYKTTAEAKAAADQALDQQIRLLGDLYDAAEGMAVFVPDTNALLYHPELDKWRFDGAKTFAFVLIPTVLGELDELKIKHRDAALRQKAEALIGRIKSYRTRGDLSVGVVVAKNVSTIRAIALEPSFDSSLPWLDPDNNDDRIIASFVEVMRQHPRSPVVLVTLDINLQNKAAVGAFPFVEPPAP